MTRGMLAVALLLVPTALLTAQTGPITVRLSPTPNQTIRTHTSQETKMTSQPEQAAPGQTIPAAEHRHDVDDGHDVNGRSNQRAGTLRGPRGVRHGCVDGHDQWQADDESAQRGERPGWRSRSSTTIRAR